jgi:hypothetical protein
MNCPVHDLEMQPKEITCTAPKFEERISRTNQCHLPTNGQGINACIQTICTDKEIMTFQCPVGCEFKTEASSITAIGERWEKY